MIWHASRIHSIFTHLIEKDMVIHQVVDTLVVAMANQKGFVSYYLIDGNSDWLKQLEKYRLDFEEYLNKVKECSLSKSDREAIERIEFEYKGYIAAKNQVIARYKAGDKTAGAELHQDVRRLFFKILQQCEDFRNIHFEKIPNKDEERRILKFPKFRLRSGKDEIRHSWGDAIHKEKSSGKI